MYVYDEEEEKTRKERILEVLSVLFYVFAVIVLVLAGLTELDPRWVLIPLSLFVVATFLTPLVTQKSWKSIIALIMAIYFCFTFVLGLFRPDLSNIVILTVNSLLGWVLIITLVIGLVLGIRRKVQRRVSKR